MKIRRRCKCGCKRITNPGRKYINGHNPPWNTVTGKIKIRRRCKCGCEGITSPGRKYINGHTWRNKEHSEEAIKKMSLSSIGKKKSEEHKRKISLAKMGNTNWVGKYHSEETKKKNSLAAIEVWQDSEYQRKQKEGRNLKPNKPEQLLMKLLDRLFPEEYKYVGDYQFFLGGKNPDFMNVNGQKKLVELFGDYWHRNANPQDRIDHFKQYGFNTLIIWEHELKESRLDLRRKLIDFHGRR